MIQDAILSVLAAFTLSAVLCPIVIPFLRKLKFGQQIRQEGPEAHLKKAGTPTMGGLVILLAIVITALIFFFRSGYEGIIPVLFVTVGFGMIGFLDDYIKVVMKRSEGLNPIQKLILQLLVSGIFCYYMYCYSGVGTQLRVPFFPELELDLGWWYIPFCIVVMLGTDNGVNFCDGLDGLCSSVTVLVAVFFTVIALGEGSDTAPISAAVVGSLLGFLLFNANPAKVFMGDTGSLALGGYVAAAALLLRMPLFILIVGFIYLAEILSVIIQVTYFKLTHGKRIFKMSPIHHHFELCGWSETRVVTVFAIITALLCLLAYLAL